MGPQCATCKASIPADFKTELDYEFQKVVRLNFPIFCQEWSNIVKATHVLRGDQVSISFIFGNTHEVQIAPSGPLSPISQPASPMSPFGSKRGARSPRNRHHWTCFFKMQNPQLNMHLNKFIQKVRFGLNDTFPEPYRDVISKDKNTKYEMSSRGWGKFEIPITIFWAKPTGLK